MTMLDSNLPPHSPLATLFLKQYELKGDGKGCIIQFEQMLDFLWAQYKLGVDFIFYDGALDKDICAAVLMTEEGTVPKNDLEGGFLITGYKSKYSVAFSNIIPLFANPYLKNRELVFAQKVEHWADVIGVCGICKTHA